MTDSQVLNVIAKEMAKSDGSVRMIKVPAEKRPTVDSLKKLGREVSAQFEDNILVRRCGNQECWFL